jgi:hypothetical protein
MMSFKVCHDDFSNTVGSGPGQLYFAIAMAPYHVHCVVHGPNTVPVLRVTVTKSVFKSSRRKEN